MTQLEDDVLLNNLLKFPGTIIIYNNDLNTYNYVLNGHNSIPLATTGSTALADESFDLNGTVSINVETVPPELPLGSPTTSTSNESVQNSQEDTCSAISSNSSEHLTESVANTSGSIHEADYEVDEMEAEDDSEPELTNLSWLTELKNITNLTPSDIPLTDLPTARFNKFIAQVRRSRESYDKRKEQYTSLLNSEEKPPFNYAQIIAMAMLDEGRMTLKQICKWIQEKFSYYKVHKNWNNSIRHNLSLSFYFTKVSRAKDEKGKGGYWELSMDVAKSEKKRIRVRQRNRGKGSGPSSRSRNRFRRDNTNNNNNSESTVNNNLAPEEDDSSSKLHDGNNNHCSPQIGHTITSAEMTTVEDDTMQNVNCINTAVSDVVSPTENQPSNSNETPSIEILEQQLIKTSALVENCTINFDSIINAETGNGIFTNLNVDEIFSGSEIPQPANDDIIVPFFGTSAQQAAQTGPNVIVETIPYFLPDMGNFDEQDFGNLININEQEISDEFLNEHGFL
ncbi:forkhead box protein J3 [Wyeomyia smithii]|uniref:forkhead box protein J3 n=1 Tax=Wyeomyia smithii TaxID=174621 RepID=UPI002467C096|nr:forkhead box protein J3 [Wyeomyia smithii]